ncbi:MAG: hypothetical protein IJZ46_02655 [Bacilli bacterium]|nr:hypothetical protein [Bacilli bacterium]
MNYINNVDYIKISIFNIYERIIIYIGVKEKQIYINEKIKEINANKINDLLNIIKEWKDTYYSSVLDAEKFSIKLIFNNQIVNQYIGSGNYPYNYNEFKNWISDII